MISPVAKALSVAVAVGLVLGVAACSSGSGHHVPVSAAVVDPPIATVFDGPALSGMTDRLSLPGGFTLVGSGSHNSGPGIAVDSSQDLAAMSCETLANDLGAEGFGEQSWAEQETATGDQTRGLDTFVYQFKTAALAQAFYTQAGNRWAGCGNFADPGEVESWSLARVPGPALPDAKVPAISGFTELAEVFTYDGTASDAVLVVALDGDAVVISAPVSSPGPQFSGGVSYAVGLDEQVLTLMNAAQVGAATPTGAVPVLPCSVAPAVGCH